MPLELNSNVQFKYACGTSPLNYENIIPQLAQYLWLPNLVGSHPQSHIT